MKRTAQQLMENNCFIEVVSGLKKLQAVLAFKHREYIDEEAKDESAYHAYVARVMSKYNENSFAFETIACWQGLKTENMGDALVQLLEAIQQDLIHYRALLTEQINKSAANLVDAKLATEYELRVMSLKITERIEAALAKKDDVLLRLDLEELVKRKEALVYAYF
jgi:hypothetical protein